jgi:hypothetical protein
VGTESRIEIETKNSVERLNLFKSGQKNQKAFKKSHPFLKKAKIFVRPSSRYSQNYNDSATNKTFKSLESIQFKETMKQSKYGFGTQAL